MFVARKPEAAHTRGECTVGVPTCVRWKPAGNPYSTMRGVPICVARKPLALRDIVTLAVPNCRPGASPLATCVRRAAAVPNTVNSEPEACTASTLRAVGVPTRAVGPRLEARCDGSGAMPSVANGVPMPASTIPRLSAARVVFGW